MRYHDYSGINTAKSSEVRLLATDGIIQKIRPVRERESLWREYFALHVWQTVLEEYNRRAPGLKILSPNPGKLDEELKAITMSFLGGNDLQFLIKKARRGHNIDGFNKEETARQLGKLLHIKEIERIAHGDFKLRHLLSGGTNPNAHENYLGMIDVEGFRPVSIEQVKFEHSKLVADFLTVDPNLRTQIEEGYDSVGDNTPSIARDVIQTVKEKIGIPKGINLYK